MNLLLKVLTIVGLVLIFYHILGRYGGKIEGGGKIIDIIERLSEIRLAKIVIDGKAMDCKIVSVRGNVTFVNFTGRLDGTYLKSGEASLYGVVGNGTKISFERFVLDGTEMRDGEISVETFGKASIRGSSNVIVEGFTGNVSIRDEKMSSNNVTISIKNFSGEIVIAGKNIKIIGYSGEIEVRG